MSRLAIEIRNSRRNHRTAMEGWNECVRLNGELDDANSRIKYLSDMAVSSEAQGIAYQKVINALMVKLDEAVGQDKNPFRIDLEGEVIPEGPRKGEQMKIIDKLFLNILKNELEDSIKNDRFFFVKQAMHTVVGSIRECKIWS